MKNKNGFVFIETMITIVILAAALLTMYTLFTGMLVNEKDRTYYDDPLYVYKASYLASFFRDRFNYSSEQMIDKEPDREYVGIEHMLIDYVDNPTEQTAPIRLYLKTVSCDNDIFDNRYYSTKKDCQRFFYQQRLYRVYISRSDLSYMSYCDSHNDQECFEYRSLRKNVKKYMKTLSYVPGSNGYYLIFEFNDDGNGNVCSSDTCMHQFATIKYGDTNQIINLNS